MRYRLAAAAWVLAVTCSLGAPFTLRLGADLYQGGPDFVVEADGVVIGSGTVSEAAGQDFEFEAPDDASTLAISFTNDLAAPVGPDGRRPDGTDRNLRIISASFGANDWIGADFRGENTSRFGDVLSLNSNTTVSIDLARRVQASTPKDSAETTPAFVCEAEIKVGDFVNGGVEVDAEQRGALSAALDGKTACKARVTGFSSTSGPSSVNERLATERAEAVAEVLVSLGMPAGNIDVGSGGETDRFGSDQASNRRVVVTLE